MKVDHGAAKCGGIQSRDQHLWDKLLHRRSEQLHRVAGVPFPVCGIKVDLHEVARDGCEDHVAVLAVHGVVEVPQVVVLSTGHRPNSSSQMARSARTSTSQIQ